MYSWEVKQFETITSDNWPPTTNLITNFVHMSAFEMYVIVRFTQNLPLLIRPKIYSFSCSVSMCSLLPPKTTMNVLFNVSSTAIGSPGKDVEIGNRSSKEKKIYLNSQRLYGDILLCMILPLLFPTGGCGISSECRRSPFWSPAMQVAYRGSSEDHVQTGGKRMDVEMPCFQEGTYFGIENRLVKHKTHKLIDA